MCSIEELEDFVHSPSNFRSVAFSVCSSSTGTCIFLFCHGLVIAPPYHLFLCSESVFEFDHVYSSTHFGSSPLAVLYAELGTVEFEQYHDALASLSNSGKLVYVFRHYIKVYCTCIVLTVRGTVYNICNCIGGKWFFLFKLCQCALLNSNIIHIWNTSCS